MWLQNRADVTCSGAQQALGTCTVPQVQEPTSLQTVLPWVKPSWFETSCQLYVGKVSVLDHSVLQTVSHKLKTGPSPKRRWHSAGGLLSLGSVRPQGQQTWTAFPSYKGRLDHPSFSAWHSAPSSSRIPTAQFHRTNTKVQVSPEFQDVSFCLIF